MEAAVEIAVRFAGPTGFVPEVVAEALSIAKEEGIPTVESIVELDEGTQRRARQRQPRRLARIEKPGLGLLIEAQLMQTREFVVLHSLSLTSGSCWCCRYEALVHRIP